MAGPSVQGVAWFGCLFLISCSVQRHVAKKENALQNNASLIDSLAHTIIDDSTLTTANVGISIYDPSTKKYLYNYNGNKYFIPASNTKIITCYAAMKYLGDSLVGAKIEEKWDAVYIIGTGDPTFLDPDYKYQPVFEFMKSIKGKKIYLCNKYIPFNEYCKPIPVYGAGWSWDDYSEEYMTERNFFPIYRNLVLFSIDSSNELMVVPKFFRRKLLFWKNDTNSLKVEREENENRFLASGSSLKSQLIKIPFKTGSDFEDKNTYITSTVDSLLSDTLGVIITQGDLTLPAKDDLKKIHSQPTDSLLKIMMHRRDNFYAEQSLLMVSNEMLGVMNDEKIIDTLLNSDFKNIPQKPSWVDGSGLSRYNLFSPQDFVFILDKMRDEFSWNRISTIFPTGGTGTLGSTYKNLEGKLFAKTGTLSNNAALSGYLITKKNKTLIFSLLVGNHGSNGSTIRKAMAQFLTSIYDNY